LPTFQVLITIVFMWGLCAILTAFDVFEAGDEARTDKNLQLLKNADWVRVPYPCKY
jgi:nucleobase transporter 1/2